MRLLVVAVLALAFALSCAGFLRPGLAVADDLSFHLYRIEGLARGLAAGEIPVRMQTSQVWAMGYPVSVFYGDLLLYPAALFRMAGLPLAQSYKLYAASVSLLTMLLTYGLVRRMLKSDLAGCIAAVLWTLAPYRLLDVYVRAAVGEYTALAALPLIAYGLYQVFWVEGRTLGWAWFALGLALVICSHTLSVLMVLVVLVPTLVLLLALRHDGRVLRSALLSTVATLALTAWFMLPFASVYQSEDLVVEHARATTRTFAGEHAALPIQLIQSFTPMEGSSMPLEEGEEGDLPYAIGAASLLGAPLAFVVLVGRIQEKKRDNATAPARPQVESQPDAVDRALAQASEEEGRTSAHEARRNTTGAVLVLFAIALLAGWLATTAFPWKVDLGFANPLVELLAMVQFPWRFVGICAFVCSLLTALCLVLIERRTPRLAFALSVLVVGLALVEGCYAIASHLFESEGRIIAANSVEELDHTTYGTQGGEYLTYGTSVRELAAAGAPFEPEPSDGLVVDAYRQQGSSHVISITANRGGRVVLPLLWYRSLATIVDGERSADVTLERSDDGRAALVVPAGFEGTIIVRMDTPLPWRLAEGLSLVSAALLGVAALVRHVRKMDGRNGDRG